MVVIPVNFASQLHRPSQHTPIQVITSPLIVTELRFWFNPVAISQHFIIPGAISIIITVVGAILTSLVVAREWERGAMETLLSTQVTRTELPFLNCYLISY